MRESVSVLQVTRESVSVLQVTRESVSGTTSRAHTSECPMKPKVLYDKIIITIVPSHTGKKLLPLALLLMLHNHNTDGNKLVI